MVEPTDFITIAILAKDKAHVLPLYLDLIEKQTYPASKIKLYIRTNNNSDHTAELLEEWVEKVKDKYSEIHYDASDVEEPVQEFSPHEWNSMRFKVLGRLRQESVDWARKRGTHYFVVDCDNFIVPETLEMLYQTRLPVIAPLLRNGDDPNSLYSNFHYITDENGYFKESQFYFDILYETIKGLIEVEVIHCTYLVRNEVLDLVNYDDGSGRFEYVVFSDELRKAGIPQYIDNRHDYGKLTFCDSEEEFLSKKIINELLSSDEANELLHSNYKNRDHSLKNIVSDDPPSHLRQHVEILLKMHNFPFETNIIFKSGGLGDYIQMTPVAKALKMKYPNHPVVAIVSNLFGSYGSIFDEHPFIDLVIEYDFSGCDVLNSLVGLVENVIDIRYVSRSYGSLENAKFSYENDWYHQNYPYSGCRLDDLNMHVSDLMLHSLGLEQYADCNDVYVVPDEVPEEIPGDYVVVCNSTGSVGAQLREWTSEEWTELIKWLNSIGIIPVQIGTKSDKLLHSGVIDLRGRTTPRQAAGYLKLSKGYIGVEGGLFHLSKAVGAPAVVIFASTPAICYAYPDTHVVTKNACRPCLWNGPWASGQCIRGSDYCLNLPDWKSVSVEVSKMLNARSGR